jgi:hypothetical protein
MEGDIECATTSRQDCLSKSPGYWPGSTLEPASRFVIEAPQVVITLGRTDNGALCAWIDTDLEPLPSGEMG